MTISNRVGAHLEREGLLVRDIENPYLQLVAPDESTINDLLGHSITYRIAVGPHAGRKAFTLQTVRARKQDNDNPNLAKTAGFSLHVGVPANSRFESTAAGRAGNQSVRCQPGTRLRKLRIQSAFSTSWADWSWRYVHLARVVIQQRESGGTTIRNHVDCFPPEIGDRFLAD